MYVDILVEVGVLDAVIALECAVPVPCAADALADMVDGAVVDALVGVLTASITLCGT